MPLHDVLRQRMQHLTAAVTSNRIFLYSVFSTFAVAATIANACRAQSNFYSILIYLSKSSRSVLVRIPVCSSHIYLHNYFSSPVGTSPSIRRWQVRTGSKSGRQSAETTPTKPSNKLLSSATRERLKTLTARKIEHRQELNPRPAHKYQHHLTTIPPGY